MCRNLDLRFLLFIVFCQSFFPPPFCFFLLSILLSFLLLSNWFLFLSSFVFPLLFWHCFIPVCLAHMVSSLAYPNLLRTKRLGCCCCETSTFNWKWMIENCPGSYKPKLEGGWNTVWHTPRIIMNKSSILLNWISPIKQVKTRWIIALEMWNAGCIMNV
jgi:hypothetical protein